MRVFERRSYQIWWRSIRVWQTCHSITSNLPLHIHNAEPFFVKFPLQSATDLYDHDNILIKLSLALSLWLFKAGFTLTGVCLLKYIPLAASARQQTLLLPTDSTSSSLCYCFHWLSWSLFFLDSTLPLVTPSSLLSNLWLCNHTNMLRLLFLQHIHTWFLTDSFPRK